MTALLHERSACTMFTLLTSPVDFASAKFTPLPSLHPPSISPSWSGHGLSTAAATLSASLSQCGGKLRPVATLAAKGIKGVRAPVLCLTSRPGSWKQLQSWFRRKTQPHGSCTTLVSTFVNGGESLQRVRPWFSGCGEVDVAKVEAKVPALSPVRRLTPAVSEAKPPQIPPVTPTAARVPPIRKHQRPKRTVDVTARESRNLHLILRDNHDCEKLEVPVPGRRTYQHCRFCRGYKKPSVLVPQCHFSHRAHPKPKKTVSFAPTELVQEYIRWNWEDESAVSELIGSPYERRFKRAKFSLPFFGRMVYFERYLEPDGHNQVNFPRTKRIRDVPTWDGVDDDGDVDMDA